MNKQWTTPVLLAACALSLVLGGILGAGLVIRSALVRAVDNAERAVDAVEGVAENVNTKVDALSAEVTGLYGESIEHYSALVEAASTFVDTTALRDAAGRTVSAVGGAAKEKAAGLIEMIPGTGEDESDAVAAAVAEPAQESAEAAVPDEEPTKEQTNP